MTEEQVYTELRGWNVPNDAAARIARVAQENERLRSVHDLIEAGLENAEDMRAYEGRSKDWLVGFRMALEGLRMALDGGKA